MVYILTRMGFDGNLMVVYILFHKFYVNMISIGYDYPLFCIAMLTISNVHVCRYKHCPSDNWNNYLIIKAVFILIVVLLYPPL